MATQSKINPLVTSAELADYLGVTRRTLKRYKSKGYLVPVRRHEFKHLWDLKKSVLAMHERGVCEDVKVPEDYEVADYIDLKRNPEPDDDDELE